MNNPVHAASAVGGWTGSRALDETHALQTGLELARASQLTMLRLQLALHGSNRRTAMQALDQLLDIDAEMADLTAALSGGPAYRPSDAALSGFIGRQKAAIAAEKHALTGSEWPDAPGPFALAAPVDGANVGDRAAHLLPLHDETGRDDRSGNRWMHILAVALVVIGIAIVLAAYLSPALPVLLSFSHFQ